MPTWRSPPVGGGCGAGAEGDDGHQLVDRLRHCGALRGGFLVRVVSGQRLVFDRDLRSFIVAVMGAVILLGITACIAGVPGRCADERVPCAVHVVPWRRRRTTSCAARIAVARNRPLCLRAGEKKIGR
jgi:hypothetical protein